MRREAVRDVKFVKGDYFSELKKMRGDIVDWFDNTKQAFDKTEKVLAETTMENAFGTAKQCDDITWKLMESRKVEDALAMGLLFRYFKRIAAHLGNICSSVTMPLDKLDYYDE